MSDRKWTAMDTSHLRHMDCTTDYETMLCERAADRIEELEAHIKELDATMEAEYGPSLLEADDE